MAVAFRSASNATANASTSLVLPVPAGVQDGDLLIAFLTIALDNTSNDFSTPTGWTLLDDSVANPPGGSRSANFWKIASSEPANYTWNVAAGADDWAGVMVAYSGADQTTPINQHAGTTSGAIEQTGVTSSITPTVDNCMIVGMFGEDGSNTGGAGSWTAGGSETVRQQTQEATNFTTSAVEDILQGTAAAITVSATYTNSPLTNSMMSKHIVAIAPASVAATQTIRPDSDIATASWTTTPLFSKINDQNVATVITGVAA